MNNNPCFGCKKRHTYCHASCGEYLAYAESCRKRNEKRMEELKADNDYRAAKKRVKKISTDIAKRCE